MTKHFCERKLNVKINLPSLSACSGLSGAVPVASSSSIVTSSSGLPLSSSRGVWVLLSTISPSTKKEPSVNLFLANKKKSHHYKNKIIQVLLLLIKLEIKRNLSIILDYHLSTIALMVQSTRILKKYDYFTSRSQMTFQKYSKYKCSNRFVQITKETARTQV